MEGKVERAQSEIVEKIKIKAKMIEGKFNGFNVWQFIQKNIRIHPEAMLKVLEKMEMQAASIHNP